jgi:hypothetical protein
MSIAILFVGGLAGLVGSLFLHHWVQTKVFRIPDLNGLPGQDGGANSGTPTTTKEG